MCQIFYVLKMESLYCLKEENIKKKIEFDIKNNSNTIIFALKIIDYECNAITPSKACGDFNGFFSISFLENEWKDKMIKSIVSNSINKTLP